jgi:pyruvate dehydrogenase E2 component (dihydrolipoamide acetyltransferase)
LIEESQSAGGFERRLAMATAIRMPDFGTTVEEVKLIEWLKKVGDPVKKGEAICVVETDKATMEFESCADGILLGLLVPPGANVEEGQIIAYVGGPGESLPGEATSSHPGAPVGGPVPMRAATEVGAGARVSPLVRNLAQREGVDLGKVAGTGPAGQITREDVMRAKAAGGDAPAPSVTAPRSTETLSLNQRAVAKRVSQSHSQIVPINLIGRIDMSTGVNLRERLLKETGGRISYDAIFVFAVSRVIQGFPRFRSRLAGDKIMPAHGSNIALAVGIGEDLYTLTVAEPRNKTVIQIEADIQSLLQKAAAGTLSLTEMSGACFTISNLGMYPVHSFNVIIPPEQSAALAVGTIEETALVRDGRVVSAPVACVTLAVDHRLINGRQGAEFLAALKEFMEKL